MSFSLSIFANLAITYFLASCSSTEMTPVNINCIAIESEPPIDTKGIMGNSLIWSSVSDPWYHPVLNSLSGSGESDCSLEFYKPFLFSWELIQFFPRACLSDPKKARSMTGPCFWCMFCDLRWKWRGVDMLS